MFIHTSVNQLISFGNLISVKQKLLFELRQQLNMRRALVGVRVLLLWSVARIIGAGVGWNVGCFFGNFALFDDSAVAWGLEILKLATLLNANAAICRFGPLEVVVVQSA